MQFRFCMPDICDLTIINISFHCFFPAISEDEMKAVSGIASTIPMLDEMPLMVSMAINAVENIGEFRKGIVECLTGFDASENFFNNALHGFSLGLLGDSTK